MYDDDDDDVVVVAAAAVLPRSLKIIWLRGFRCLEYC